MALGQQNSPDASGNKRAHQSSETNTQPAYESAPASPLRYLLLVVPILVIAVTATNLLGIWRTPQQQAMREQRQIQIERDRQIELAEQERLRIERDRDGAPDEPGEVWLALRKLLQKLGQLPSEQTSTPAPQPPLPAPIENWEPRELPSQQSPTDEPAPFDAAIVVSNLESADISNGAAEFRKCAICHENTKGAPARIGPNLWGVTGRPKASLPDFRYSRSLRKLGGIWSDEDLAGYLHDPRKFAPGTSMTFAGIRDSQKMANLIAYLRTRSGDEPERQR